jgi:hypothetical protein
MHFFQKGKGFLKQLQNCSKCDPSDCLFSPIGPPGICGGDEINFVVFGDELDVNDATAIRVKKGGELSSFDHLDLSRRKQLHSCLQLCWKGLPDMEKEEVCSTKPSCFHAFMLPNDPHNNKSIMSEIIDKIIS